MNTRILFHRRLGKCVVTGSELINGVRHLRLLTLQTKTQLRLYVAIDQLSKYLEVKE